MLTWINFLHLYQPPTQTKAVVDQVVLESYALIPQLLRQYPRLRLTVNFSGSLLELLETYGYHALLDEYREYATAGRIELVGSAMYHPILAMLPEEEIRRQIKLHTAISERIFGLAYHPKGFFIPEMAYGKNVADVARTLGFEWTLLDEVHFPNGRRPDNTIRYTIAESGLGVIFRSRAVSKAFPPEYIVNHQQEFDGQSIVTAHDGELYGHWHKDDRGYYERAFSDPEVRLLTVSEYLGELSQTMSIVPRTASWESSEEELRAGEPFILWNARENTIHQSLWEFARFVLRVVQNHREDVQYSVARQYADRALASCAWWWASGAKLSPFSPISWNPTEIEKGAREFLLALRSIKKMNLSTRLEGETMYADLSARIWKTHWEKNSVV